MAFLWPPAFVLLIHIYWKAFPCTHPSLCDGWRVRVGFLLARLIPQTECQRCTGCIKSSWNQSSVCREETRGKKCYGLSAANSLWIESSAQHKDFICSACANLVYFVCQCPGCLLLKNTFKCNLEQPLVWWGDKPPGHCSANNPAPPDR